MGVTTENFSLVRDLRVAVLFLTRVPVGRIAGLEAGSLAAAAWAFPLAGLIVGGISGGVLYTVAGTEISPLGCALVALVVQAVVIHARVMLRSSMTQIQFILMIQSLMALQIQEDLIFLKFHLLTYFLLPHR